MEAWFYNLSRCIYFRACQLQWQNNLAVGWPDWCASRAWTCLPEHLWRRLIRLLFLLAAICGCCAAADKCLASSSCFDTASTCGDSYCHAWTHSNCMKLSWIFMTTSTPGLLQITLPHLQSKSVCTRRGNPVKLYCNELYLKSITWFICLDSNLICESLEVEAVHSRWKNTVSCLW